MLYNGKADPVMFHSSESDCQFTTVHKSLILSKHTLFWKTSLGDAAVLKSL
jgi:hypothetical protein